MDNNIFDSSIEEAEILIVTWTERILLTKSKLSIRLIDYFITKYSKINKITYSINNSLFNIFISYKQQLKIYQKKYFDPFSRGNRIPFFLYNNSFITTIGQLNFFKWFIEKNIYYYILDNYINIENSMNINNKEIKDNKKNIKYIKKKNNNISKNNIIHNYTNNINNTSIIVSFTF